jgi:hypothetical protein
MEPEPHRPLLCLLAPVCECHRIDRCAIAMKQPCHQNIRLRSPAAAGGAAASRVARACTDAAGRALGQPYTHPSPQVRDMIGVEHLGYLKHGTKLVCCLTLIHSHLVTGRENSQQRCGTHQHFSRRQNLARCRGGWLHGWARFRVAYSN